MALVRPDTSLTGLKTSMFELKMTELFRLSNEKREFLWTKLALGPVGFLAEVLLPTVLATYFDTINGDLDLFFGLRSFWWSRKAL